MDNIQVIDNENYFSDPQYSKIIKKGEKLLWSGHSLKINSIGKIQNRLFLITTSRIINVGKRGNFLTNMFSKLIRREFKIELIEAITYSELSNNFIFHIPSEYDYYLCCSKKDEMLLQVIRVLIAKGKKGLPFHVVSDIDLFKYCMTEGTVKLKWPNVQAQIMTEKLFEDMLREKKSQLENNIRNTEIILSKHGDIVHEGSFNILKVLGKGHFGTVFLVQKRNNNKLYALKVISKLDIIKQKFFTQLKSEREILNKIDHPFVVNMEYCFASPTYIFFAMEFKQGGEIYYHMRKKQKFSEKTTKFYAAQIISGLSYLHSQNIMYRDLKPENILLDKDGNACLADFGISKIMDINEKTKTYVGTPEYVAPEIILHKGHDKKVDIWCFGILIYEMVFGMPPFYNDNTSIMMNWIVKMEPVFGESVKVSPLFKDLVKKVF